MAQADLVATFRAYKKAQERAKEARETLDREIRIAVGSEEWRIADIADLTGWSRETVRKIAHLYVEPPSS
jgi:hypothetical protein